MSLNSPERLTARRASALGIVLALASSSLIGTAVAHADSIQPSTAPPATASKLFVQDASEATAERIRGKRWKVTLTNVDPTTLWFTDRPLRDAGRQSTASFVRQWTEFGFAVDPPNAVIQHSDSDGVAVELRNPRYDRSRATLTYTAILDPGSGERLDRRMRQVSVFIDDAGTVLTPVVIEATSLAPAGTLRITLSEPSGELDPNYAAFAPMSTQDFGATLLLATPGGEAIPVQAFSVSPTEISLVIGEFNSSGSVNATVTLFIETPATVEDIALTFSAASGALVTAQVGNAESQAITSFPTVFSLNA